MVYRVGRAKWSVRADIGNLEVVGTFRKIAEVEVVGSVQAVLDFTHHEFVTRATFISLYLYSRVAAAKEHRDARVVAIAIVVPE